MRLSPEITAAGYRLITFAATDSTNSDAAQAAREGDPGRLWIVAREQRAGRGRHGRAWASPPGNLYASLLLVEPCPPALAPQLGFIAGLALHEAVASAAGLDVPHLALKWPNDLLFAGAKVAGVLLEGSQGVNGAFAVAIGFGVNLAEAPADTPYRAIALHEIVGEVGPETLFGGLAHAFAKHFEGWSTARASGEGDAFAAIRRQWLARAAGLGEAVTIRLPKGERNGVFLGLDAAGRLQLGTPGGTELIDAGDLYFAHLHTGAQAPSLRQVG